MVDAQTQLYVRNCAFPSYFLIPSDSASIAPGLSVRNINRNRICATVDLGGGDLTEFTVIDCARDGDGIDAICEL